MPESYQGIGLSFLYPDGWKVESDDESDTFTIESPSGAFLAVSRFPQQEEDPEVEAPIDKAKKAMEEEYDEVEQEYLTKEFSDYSLIGVTQRFVYLDMIITSSLLTLDYETFAYLFQMQAEDREMEQLAPVFDAIMTSMCQSLAAKD